MIDRLSVAYCPVLNVGLGNVPLFEVLKLSGKGVVAKGICAVVKEILLFLYHCIGEEYALLNILTSKSQCHQESKSNMNLN